MSENDFTEDSKIVSNESAKDFKEYSDRSRKFREDNKE